MHAAQTGVEKPQPITQANCMHNDGFFCVLLAALDQNVLFTLQTYNCDQFVQAVPDPDEEWGLPLVNEGI